MTTSEGKDTKFHEILFKDAGYEGFDVEEGEIFHLNCKNDSSSYETQHHYTDHRDGC